MGLFSRFLAPLRPPPSHPVFGRMWFQRDGQGEYWECETTDGLSVSVVAGPDGPSEAQATFYLATLNDLDGLVRRCNPALTDSFASLVGRPMATDWRRDLEFRDMMVPANADPNDDWDASFEMRVDPGLTITVELRGGAPFNVRSDG